MGNQLSLRIAKRPPPNGTWWGGRRKGAGRKPTGRRAGASHAARAAPSPKFPMHISLRVVADVPRLRQRRGYQIVRRALARANRWDDARLCEVSIQGTHVHLIVEADTRAALSRTMKSFTISMAKNVNRCLRGRGGPVLDDRYHVVTLRTPSQTRAAIAYVLGNWRRHGEDLRLGGPRRMTDVYSSGPRFDSWSIELPDMKPPDDGWLPTRRARSWLLRAGWKLAGPISPWDRPGPLAR